MAKKVVISKSHQHNFRIDDQLWDQVLRATEANGTNVTEIVRKFLVDYVEATRVNSGLGVHALPKPLMPAAMRKKLMRDKAKARRKHSEKVWGYRTDSFMIMPESHEIAGRGIPKESCKHIVRRQTAFGTWCVDCATLIRPKGLGGDFIQYLGGKEAEFEPEDEADIGGNSAKDNAKDNE